MDIDPIDSGTMQDRQALLERSFIDEYIRSHGHDPATLHELAPEQMHELLKAAAIHAAMKLAEVESRAHYVHEIHGDRT